MKVVLDYDQHTGQLMDKTGAVVGTWAGVETLHAVVAPQALTVKDVVTLTEAGVAPAELQKLREVGLL